MKELYKKLNYYLNDICNYLEKENSFLLENINSICKLNDSFLKFIENYNLETKPIQNNLTYEDVYYLAREIIEHIDKKYLEDFDNLIQSGELDFGYDHTYEDSECINMYKNGTAVKQIININREFNYSDVRILVHEFIHYTNGKKFSINRNYFSEFLSIYFEFYAIDYLLKKEINKQEIDYLFRIKNLTKHSIIFFQYETVLLAYIKYGNIDENTISFLQQYFLNIQNEAFEKECITLYKNLCIAEEKNKEKIKKNPNELGRTLSEEFITFNYKYILGTFLAIYAYQYCDFNDIVYLNNHINEYNDKSIFDICLSIGIDLKDEYFSQKLFNSIEEYIRNKQPDYKKGI